VKASSLLTGLIRHIMGKYRKLAFKESFPNLPRRDFLCATHVSQGDDLCCSLDIGGLRIERFKYLSPALQRMLIFHASTAQI
jgi:hypothetical protein